MMASARAIVVGVDGSESNQAALALAAREASDSGRQLHLVAAVEEDGYPFLERPITTAAEDALERAAHQARLDHPGLVVQTAVRLGHPVSTLIHQLGSEDILVVGKRGLGAVRRLLVGSTSIRAAGRATSPVLVVPPEWDAAEHTGGPVVVGIDPEHDHGQPLQFAFEEAARRGVTVRVAHAVNLELVMTFGGASVSSADLHDWEERSAAAVEDAVKPFAEQHPDVSVEIVTDRGHAATQLLEHATDAQLIVLGRRHRGPASWGLGSVARGVLHGAEAPVAIIPVTKG